MRSATTRRAQVRAIAEVCSRDFERAIELLDDGRHATGLRNAVSAVTACHDVIDAVDGHEIADNPGGQHA